MTTLLEDPFAIHYFVVFHSTTQTPYEPILFKVPDLPRDTTTLPHAFDREVVPALDAIEHCLQLPRTLLDVFDVSASALYRTRQLDLPHDILLMPSSAMPTFLKHPAEARLRPTLVLAPRIIEASIVEFAQKLNCELGVTFFDALGPDSRRVHWEALAALAQTRMPERAPILAGVLPDVPRTARLADLLPSLFDARQLHVLDKLDPAKFASPHDALSFRLWTRSRIHALAELEARWANSPIDDQMIDSATDKARRKLRLPLAIGMPGVPRKYVKEVHGRDFVATPKDGETELRVVNLCIAHRAAATNGMAGLTAPVPEDVFHALAALEKHAIEAQKAQPQAVWRLLRHMSKRMNETMDPTTKEALHRADRIHAFSNFPIGIVTLDPDTAPLVCSAPVSLRPILPLTRTLQAELPCVPYTYLKAGLRVLVAECLEPHDRIRPISMSGWAQLQATVKRIPGASCEIKEVQSPEQLNSELACDDYDILIVSAHGVYGAKKNLVGLKFATGVSVGLEFTKIPPLVILSACHSSPRGVAAVSIGDLLIRQGALAVLGTLIPISVTKNVLLMNRLFTYIAEALLGNAAFRTIEDVWHYVVASNAVVEIMSATDRLMRIFSDGPVDDSVLTEFMMQRSKGRLRLSHIYEDTGQVLMEIARERKFVEYLEPVLKGRQYFPESIFYTMIGRPDRIVISDETSDAVLAAIQAGA